MGFLKRLLGRTPSPAADIAAQWGKVFDDKERVLVDIGPFRLAVMGNDYVVSSIMAYKTYEPHVTQVLKGELRPDDVFLDIGANVGFFTMTAWSIVKGRGKVISIEPNPGNVQLIYASIVENKAENVHVYPYAASNAAGILRFANIGSNGLVVTDQSPEQRHSLYVQSVVLDDLLKDEPKIDVVKIDIEAYEPFALMGMTKLIERHRPRILTEFHPWALQYYNLLEPTDYLERILRFGYDLFIIEETGALVPAASAEAVMAHYRGLGEETRHLDLFARPRAA